MPVAGIRFLALLPSTCSGEFTSPSPFPRGYPKTSRTQLDRLLNPKTDITLSSLQRAAAMVGRRVMIEVV